jgi:hypothetical protein
MSKLLSVLIASLFAAVSYTALAEEGAPAAAPAAMEKSEGSDHAMKAEHSKKEKHAKKEKSSKKEKHSKQKKEGKSEEKKAEEKSAEAPAK